MQCGIVAAFVVAVGTAAACPAGETPMVLAEHGVAGAIIVVEESLLPKPKGPAAPMLGRYVRLSNPGDRLMLAEVEVFSGGVNVAKGKPATQKGQWIGCAAANAVDGETNAEHDRCSVGDMSGEWEVDLGQSLAIDRIVVYNTDSRNAYRMANLIVSVLDDNRTPKDWFKVRKAEARWEFDANLYRTGDAANLRTAQAFDDLCHYLKSVTGAEFVREHSLTVPASYRTFCFPVTKVRYFDQQFFERSTAFFDEAEKAVAGHPEADKYMRRVRRSWLSPARAFLSKWTLTAQEWIGQGKNLRDYPLDHDAILAKYRSVYEDYVRQRHGGVSPELVNKHMRVLGARYVEMPLPEAFREMPCPQVYDFPVATNELLAARAVTREKDEDEREVLVVRNRKDLWPIRFFNNDSSRIAREIANAEDIRWNEYAWYHAGRYAGVGSGSWRGNLLYRFSIITPPDYYAEALITLGVADPARSPFEGWVEMKVIPGADYQPKEIRVSRVIRTTGKLTAKLEALKFESAKQERIKP